MRRIVAVAVLLTTLSASAIAQPIQSWGPTYSPTAKPTTLTGLPATITGSGHWTSSCIPATSARAFDVYAELTGNATLQVQRYADVGTCLQSVGAAVPSTALALTTGSICPGSTRCGDVGSNDGLPFSALVITVTDTSAATNTVNAVTLQQGAE